MTNEQNGQGYEFGPFRLDAAEGLLLRAERIVPLTPKAFETLHTLVKNSGHIVSKEQLLQAVWPDSFVEENNLAVHISTLRKVLGENEQGTSYIENIPKRGYRCVGHVRQTRGAAAPRTACSRRRSFSAGPWPRPIMSGSPMNRSMPRVLGGCGPNPVFHSVRS